MSSEVLLSQRGYAKHRGCALSTVQRAIKDQRIAAALVEAEGKTLINAAKADELWVQNTDPRRANNYKGAKGQDEIYSPKPKAKKEEPEEAPKQIDFQTNRAIREAYQARMAKLNYEKESGKLVEAELVKKYILKIHGRARDSLLNLPDKVGPKIAAETDIHRCIEILNKEIQIVCNQFSRGDIDL